MGSKIGGGKTFERSTKGSKRSTFGSNEKDSRHVDNYVAVVALFAVALLVVVNKVNNR
jgi:hypothetical protein